MDRWFKERKGGAIRGVLYLKHEEAAVVGGVERETGCQECDANI